MTKIPIRNVYFLLCYALRHLDEAEVAADELDALDHVHDLLGHVLALATARLLRRGLDRDYRETADDLRGVRGKILAGDTATRALRRRGQVRCRFDELSHDVLHNQILKSTLLGLLQIPALDAAVRAEVRRLVRSLAAVSTIRVSRQAFRRVQIDRNRRLDHLALAVCRLLHECVLVEQGEGAARVFDFREDDHQMWRLFEEFVTEFLRREQSRFTVNRDGRRIRWSAARGVEAAGPAIPRMEADIILESPSRRIILDTKYYGQALRSGNLRSENLYQLLAYLRNRQALLPVGARHEGIILYPVVDRPFAIDVQLEGFRVQARSIDLASPWATIRRDLLVLVDEAE